MPFRANSGEWLYSGVQHIDISLEDQTVKVTTRDDVSYDTVHEKIKRTGKEILSEEMVD